MSENKVKKVAVNTTINGEEMDILVDPYISLLETLREVVGITGTKEGCNDGNCGACTINLDGRIVDSCLVLGVEAEGKNIETVEGMATPDGLHPLQQAFLEEAALQCGICTPGFLVSAKALLDNEPDPSEERIRHWLAGNLCRCTGYDKIVKAVTKASKESK
ncbi:MAG: ferredoxin [Dehalococcoidia bacterium]|jgi:carbon-monoxide dehydrogenase small subunit|nr:ferredoxin [Chloroflexota bacterium]MBE31616.1 ferredoxin [Rickettsiales bacterium]MBN32958.1 ferredoxin [Dehalococcoidia bacterium]|tara:strand:+ start:1101 stop:1586 length:486 start_codon:yes stop_codon:yes gene_type:complete